MRIARPHRGFTIVEVLATMALLAIVLPVLNEAISTATHTASDARRRTEAAALAESKLTEIISTGAWENGSAMAGDFSPDWPDYHWTASVGDWTQSGLEQIDVHVTWTGRNGPRDIQITSLVYNGVNAGNGSPGNGSNSGSTSGGAAAGGGSGAKGSGSGSGGSSGSAAGGAK